MRLKDSKEAVESLAARHGIVAVSSPVAARFALAALLAIAGAGVLYFLFR